jgi:hypothetical protein
MDLKALIAKMDQIESKQLLNEGFPTVADAKARADKEKTTGKFDKKELSTGTQYTRKSSTFDDGGKDKDQKKAEKKKKNEGINFQSSIAQMLLREFGLEEKVTLPADGSTPAVQQVKTPGGTVTQSAPAANNPWANDPAKSAAWAALTPQDQKWLGGADPTDSAILARAPNKGKPAAPAAAPAAAAPAASQAVNPDSQQGQMLAKQTAGMNDPQSGVAGVQGGSEQDRMLATQTAGMDQEPAAPAAAAAPAIDPKKIARFKELLAKAGGAAAPAAGGTAAAKAKAKPDPKVMALQQELIKKGAKIKADGIMGPQTMAAQKQFGAKASGSPAANPIKNTDTNTQGVGGLDVSGSMVGA